MATQEELKNALNNKDEIYTKFKTLVNKINTLCYPSEFGDVSYYGLLRDIVKFLIDMSKVWDITDNLVNDTIANYDKKWEDINNQWNTIQSQFEEMTQENQEFKNGINQEFNEFKNGINQELNEFKETVNQSLSNAITSDGGVLNNDKSIKDINNKNLMGTTTNDNYFGNINKSLHIESKERPFINIDGDNQRLSYLSELIDGVVNLNTKNTLYIDSEITISLDVLSKHINIGNQNNQLIFYGANRPVFYEATYSKQIAYLSDLTNGQNHLNSNIDFKLSDEVVLFKDTLNSELHIGNINETIKLLSKNRPQVNVDNMSYNIAYFSDFTPITQIINEIDPTVGFMLTDGSLHDYHKIGVELESNNKYIYLEIPLELNVIGATTYKDKGELITLSCKITNIDYTNSQISFDTSIDGSSTQLTTPLHKVYLYR